MFVLSNCKLQCALLSIIERLFIGFQLHLDGVERFPKISDSFDCSRISLKTSLVECILVDLLLVFGLDFFPIKAFFSFKSNCEFIKPVAFRVLIDFWNEEIEFSTLDHAALDGIECCWIETRVQLIKSLFCFIDLVIKF